MVLRFLVVLLKYLVFFFSFACGFLRVSGGLCEKNRSRSPNVVHTPKAYDLTLESPTNHRDT